MYKKYIKRLLDILLSSLAIIILSPILVFVAIWIKLDSDGPILFKQKRVGKNKEYFMILKFRTMFISAPNDIPTHLLQNPDNLITKSGKFLRKNSLDELPQIFNILVGKMSIIGPRPALWNQFDLIKERDRYGVNELVPGLTGWAQVNGRDELEIEDKAYFDGLYKKKISFFFDCKCFFRTIYKVLKSENVLEGTQ